MGTDADWLADRTQLRTLLRTQPAWTNRDFATALRRSLSWVKKWRARIQAAPDDDAVLRSRSRARLHPPPKLDPLVIERILAIRDTPPEHLQRTPGPKAIGYYLARDPQLQAQGLRLPRSSRTIWQILRAAGRILPRAQRLHHPLERPTPMSSWQLDFKDVSTVPAEAEGKQQHVVEVLDIVDVAPHSSSTRWCGRTLPPRRPCALLCKPSASTGYQRRSPWIATRALSVAGSVPTRPRRCCDCSTAWVSGSPSAHRSALIRMPLLSATIVRLPGSVYG
jgi:hypothetical protein